MPGSTYLHLKSARFPILMGEEDELVNEGTYGKSLALYLEEKLKLRGYAVPFSVCEDWGWWVEIKGQPYALGVCIFATPESAAAHEYCLCLSRDGGRFWQWTRFRFHDTTARVQKLFADVQAIFAEDCEVQFLGLLPDCPLG